MQNVGEDQNDTLHVRTFAHSDIARDLPEDLLLKCTIRQFHTYARGLPKVARYLNDEDALFVVLAIALRCIGDGDV
jgi:hypothetical protein